MTNKKLLTPEVQSTAMSSIVVKLRLDKTPWIFEKQKLIQHRWVNNQWESVTEKRKFKASAVTADMNLYSLETDPDGNVVVPPIRLSVQGSWQLKNKNSFGSRVDWISVENIDQLPPELARVIVEKIRDESSGLMDYANSVREIAVNTVGETKEETNATK